MVFAVTSIQLPGLYELLATGYWLVLGHGKDYRDRKNGRRESASKQQHLAQEHIFLPPTIC